MILLLTLALTACDDAAKPVPTDRVPVAPEVLAAQAPPSAMASLRYGSTFVRGCWFATFTDEQRTALAEAATSGAVREASARTGVSAGMLDVTAAIAEGQGPAELAIAAETLASAERTYLDAQLESLVALVALLETEQLDAGGAQSAAKALSTGLTGNAWLAEHNPFDRAATDDEAALAGLVASKLGVTRTFLAFQLATAAPGAAIAGLDVSAPDWKTTYSSAQKALLDGWETHRKSTVLAYAQWAVTQPEVLRNRLVLGRDIEGALSLPPADPAMEAGGAGTGQGVGEGGMEAARGGQAMEGQGMDGQKTGGQGPEGQGMSGQGMEGQGMGGQGMGGQGMGGQGMGGQGMGGQGMGGQGMGGQGMGGQGMGGQGMGGQGMGGQGMGGQGMGGQGMGGKQGGQGMGGKRPGEKAQPAGDRPQ